MKQEKLSVSSMQENLLLKTFPFIRRLTAQKLSRFCLETVEDITQQVMLKLHIWKTKRNEQTLSEEEWFKLANTATQNEIRKYYSKQKLRQEVLISEISRNGSSPDWLIDKSPKFKIEGNTDEELYSLLIKMWKEIQNQSLREKYAILFNKIEIIRYFISYRCCSIEELADALELTRIEFLVIYKTLPLLDKEIAHILERKLNRQITSEKVRKARQRARIKLEQFSDKITAN